MNEQIQNISSGGYTSVQPASSPKQVGEENGEPKRPDHVAVQEAEVQQDEIKKTEKVLSDEELEKLFSEAQEKYQAKGVELHFSFHKETGQIQVEVVNAANDKVIRKIPRDELLKLSTQIKEMAGSLFDRSI